MCPICVATAVLIAGSVITTGGLGAIAIARFGMKKPVDPHPNSIPSEEERHDY